MPRLIVRERGEERILEFDAEKTTIGRSKGCSVVISDSKASRLHCQIEKSQEGFLLTDMGSMNGTFLNGRQVEREVLTIGDVIGIGDAVIIFERAIQAPVSGESSSSAPLPEPGLRTPETAPPSASKQARLALVVISGPEKGKEVSVGDEPIIIGRHRTNALPLADEKVSGSHARIYKEGEVYILTDLRSTNGTYIGSRKIEREVIDHNTIFRVGDTTLLFKDRARREDKEVPQESEFEAVDLQQALKEKKTSSLVTFLYSVAAVFLVLSILYFGFVIFGKLLRTKSSEFPSNSLITSNWSFEEKSSDESLPGWIVHKMCWSLDENIKKSGKESLLLDLSSLKGEEGVEAKYESPIPVRPQTDYMIRLWMKTENILRCGVKLTWLDQSSKEFRYDSYACLASGTNNLSLSKEKVSPPPRASHFEIRLFALGTLGRCWFDDIEVQEQPAQPELASSRTIALADRMRAVFDSRGMFELYRYSTLMLWGGGIALQKQEGREPLLSHQALCEAEKDFSKTSESQALFSGRIFDSATDTWLPFTISVSSDGERIIVTARFSGALKEETGVGFIFYCGARRLEEDGIEVSAGDAVKTERGEFQAENVRELVLGSRDTLLSVLYDEPSRVTASKTGSAYKVSASRKLKREEKDPQISLTFSCISLQEAQRVEESLARIENLRREGRLAEASDLATRARATIARGAEVRARFDSLLTKIEEDGKALSDETKKVFEDAKKTLHPEILAALEKMAQRMELAFPDSDAAKKAQELVNSAKGLAAAQEAETTGARAKRLLDTAKSCKDRGMLNLAIIYYEYVRDNFPDTEWEKEALRHLEIIQQKKRVEERW